MSRKFPKLNFFLITSLVFLALSAFIIIITPNLAHQQDFPGHLDKAKHQPLNSYLQGWNLTNFAGFNEDLYPNGYHYLLKLFLTLTSTDEIALKSLTFLIIVLQVTALYQVTKPSKLIFLFSLLFLSIGDGTNSLLHNLPATILAGTGPASLGLALFLFTLALLKKPLNSSSKITTLGLLIGFSLLTHTISALVILILVFCYFLKQDRRQIFIATLIGLLIGLPWIWVALNPYFTGSRLNMAGEFKTGLPLLILTILLFKRRHPITLAALILVILGSTPLLVSDWLWQHQIVGFHFYRFIPFAGFLLITLLPSLLKTKSISLKKYSFIYLAILLTFTQFTELITKLDVQFDSTNINQLSGRILDVSPHTQYFHIPSTIPYALTQTNPQLTAGEGLFFESSPLGILYYSLENKLSPKSYHLGIDDRLLKENFNFPRYNLDLTQAEDLLGINYYISSSPKKLTENPTTTYLGQAVITQPDQSYIPIYLYAKPGSSRPLVEPLDYLPLPSNQSFLDWWPDANLTNLFRMPSTQDQEFDQLITLKNLNLAQPQITNIHITHQSISYTVNSPNPVPVLIKFAYNPYFQAISNQKTTPISQVSPGFMLILSQGETTITWHQPQLLTLIQKISLLAMLLSITNLAISIKKSIEQPG